MTDEPGCAILAVVAFLGLFALLGYVIWFAATMRAWGLLAAMLGLLALYVLMLCCGRDRQPRERRVAQKGARWP